MMLHKSLLYVARKRKTTLGQWVLSRDPLVLNDTAMALLRGWIEYTDHDDVMLRENIQQELIHEIWLLWTFPDLRLERYLPWHIVFNTTLMMMAEMLFISSYEYAQSNRRFMNGYDRKCFIEQLEIAYKETREAAEFTFGNG